MFCYTMLYGEAHRFNGIQRSQIKIVPMKEKIKELFKQYYNDETMPVVELEDKVLALFDVVGQSEQLADDKSYQPCDGCNTSCKEWEIFFCKKLG